MADANAPTVLNNTIISNFAVIGRLDLLPQAFPIGYLTTPAVINELAIGVSKGRFPFAVDVGLIPVVEFDDEEVALLDNTHGLGLGEWSCIVVAHRRGYVFATDDLDARREASRRGVLTSGTIRALLVLVRHEILSLEAANGLLSAMLAAGYRAPVDRLDSLV